MSRWFKSVLAKANTQVKEGHVEASDIEMREVLHHGVPPAASVVAYDPVQHVLAVGTDRGAVKLFGKPGVERMLPHEHESAVCMLHWVVNTGRLLVFFSDGVVEAWDTARGRLRRGGQVRLACSPMCACVAPQCKFAFVGTNHGQVRILDVDRMVLSTYTVHVQRVLAAAPPSPASAGVPPDMTPSVVAIDVSPTSNNALLFATDTESIVLWDVRAQRAQQVWRGVRGVRALSWHAAGKLFATGHVDGEVRVWSSRDAAPARVFFVTPGDATDRVPVTKLEWCGAEERESCLFVIGGVRDGADIDGLVAVHDPTRMPHKHVHITPTPATLMDVALLTTTPWRSVAGLPPAAALVCANGAVILQDRANTGRALVELPPFSRGDGVHALCYSADVGPSMVDDLRRVRERRGLGAWKIQYPPPPFPNYPLFGGEFSRHGVLNPLVPPEVMLTAHADGRVRVWDCTSTAMLEVLSFALPIDSPVSAMWFGGPSRTLIVGCANGALLTFAFSVTASFEEEAKVEEEESGGEKKGGEGVDAGADGTGAGAGAGDGADGAGAGAPPTLVKIEPGFQLRDASRDHAAPVLHIAYSSLLQRVVTADATGVLRIARAGSETVLFVGQPMPAAPITHVSVQEGVLSEDAPDGTVRTRSVAMAVIGAQDGALVMLDVASGETVLSVAPKRKSAVVAAFFLTADGAPCRVPTMGWAAEGEGEAALDAEAAAELLVEDHFAEGEEVEVVDKAAEETAAPEADAVPVERRESNAEIEAQLRQLDALAMDDDADGEGAAAARAVYCVSVVEDMVRLYTLPGLATLDKRALDEGTKVLKASVLTHVDGHHYLALFTPNAVLFFSLPNLHPVTTVRTDWALGASAARTCLACTHDGRVVRVAGRAITRSVLLATTSAWNTPASYAHMHRPGVVMPEQPKGFFKSLFAVSADYDALFGTAEAPAPASPGARGGASSAATAGVQRELTGAERTMAEARKRIAERGEKLSTLEEKTREMTEAAEDFASLARQLAEKEKRNASFFGGLF